MSFVVLDEQVVQIRRVAAKLGLGLDEDLVEKIEADESLLPSAANEDVEVVHGLFDRDALLHRHVVVDDQIVLRVVGGVEGEQIGHLLAFLQGGHEFFGHFTQSLVIGGERFIEDQHRDAAGRAKAGNRGGFEEFELHVAYPAALILKVGNQLARGSRALGPVFQIDDAGPRVRAAAFGQNLIAGQRCNGCDLLDLLGDFFELLRFGVRVLERGAGRGLQDGINDALILARDET